MERRDTALNNLFHDSFSGEPVSFALWGFIAITVLVVALFGDEEPRTGLDDWYDENLFSGGVLNFVLSTLFVLAFGFLLALEFFR